jgi:ribosomal protein S13
MARIAGINIPPQKHAEIGLTAIFGIGRTRARKICEACEIDYAKKIKDLTDSDLDQIAGRRTELEGLLQKRYGYTKEWANREVDEFLRGM